MPTKGYPGAGSTAGDEPTRTMLELKGDYGGAVFEQRYRIERELGRGNIGVVYLASDQQLHERPVVIKVLLDSSGESQWFRKKFQQEIEALARLDHPGIVGPVGSGETPDGKAFIAMQYIKGKNLRSKIDPDGMNFGEVAKIIRQAGQALSAAHAEGIIHCDLKPENIMLQELEGGDFQTKIVDFGIAKVKNSQVASSNARTSIAGTPAYMSPEQVEGKPGPATDIFALGVICYEMLTGRRPFNPPTPHAILSTIREGVKIKPKLLRLDLPDSAQDIILKALSYQPEDRNQRARDFGELLAQSLTTDLELGRETEAKAERDLELAHVLFMDLVGYSKLPTDAQTQLVKELQQIVTATEAYQKAKRANELISRSTGDGMALVFLSGPKAPVECAIEIAQALKSQQHIAVRMGINSGPVYLLKDMNETVDVAGAGINMAQRVMDCGDSGHILLSRSVADVLTELGEWRSRIHDLGAPRVKHGVRVHIYSMHFGDIGNPRRPKMISKRDSLVAAMVIGLVAVLAAAAVVIIIARNKGPDGGSKSNRNDNGVVHSESDRMFSYSLTVNQISNGKPAGEPHTIAGDGGTFEGRDVKINVRAAQSAQLYVLSERPGVESGVPRYQLIYHMLINSPQTIPDADRWIPPLEKGKSWRLWLVWSDDPVGEVGYIESLPDEAHGQVEAPARNKVIQDFLFRYKTASAQTQGQQTDVTWKGKTVSYELVLQY